LLRALLADQRFLTLTNIDNPAEGYVIRATGDPIYRLYRALDVALKKDPGLRDSLTAEKADALSAALNPRSVYETLREICSGLTAPLIITIDQAEEILTLVDATITRPWLFSSSSNARSSPTINWQTVEQNYAGGHADSPKERFFELIEKLCCSDIR